MDWFEYKGYDEHGTKHAGQLEATDKSSALVQLKSQGILASEIKEMSDNKGIQLSFSSRLNNADLELLTSELSILLENGVKIDRGLDIIAKSAKKPPMARLLREISKTLKQGNTLADALAEQDHIFDPLYINLVRLGEMSGTLPQIFKRLSQDLKFRQALSQKISQAIAYPLIIMLVCIGSLFFVFNFIVPRMASLFADVPDLPWYTSLMLGASDWVINYQLTVLIALVIGASMFYWAWNQAEYKRKIIAWFLQLPLVRSGSLVIERIRFNAGLTMMLEAGVAIDKALKLSLGNLVNPALKREMEIAVKKISSGNKLSDTLAETSLYPDFFIALLQVGEETASLPNVFDEITKRSRDAFESMTQRVTALLEPALILFMGGIVGSVVVVMLMSMVSVNDIAF